MKQNALTVFVPVRPDSVERLKKVLAQVTADLDPKKPKRWFARSPSTHFGRWVVLPTHDKKQHQLYFSTCYDGELDAYLNELVDAMAPDMDQIWNNCEGYTPHNASDPASYRRSFAAFINKYTLKTQAFYVSCDGATVRDIVTSAEIRKTVEKALDSEEVRGHLEQVDDLLPHVPPAPVPLTPSRPDIRERKRQARQPKSPFTWLARFIEWVVGVKLGKHKNTTIETRQDLASIEDLMVQNQMTIITRVKRGRLLFLRLVLFLADLGAKGTQGALGDIATIHFCRWVIINNGQDLLFESNYDGSWENYIDDFGDSASLEMDAIWSNCEGFPEGGSLDIDLFKRYIRDNQFPAQVFYSAYPDATVQNILNDLHFARLVQDFMAELVAKRFLSGSYILRSLGSKTWKTWKKLTRTGA